MSFSKLFAPLASVQLPTTVLLVAVLAYDVWLRSYGGSPEGLGLPPAGLEALALVAGALGIARPSELAGRLSDAVGKQ